ncbi:hypothetical protein BV210_02380 [Halorientalis sp. IM1011]|uniref:class I SAM-dependent methyltransferase n=1 Tax=Halorientalis sp. IM1011 TaxID=1932360 RepID=UPI00097CD4C8|nr:class I SAM-dependent methyltransferase [Halorientalis sp. IM1011]AQL41631.1 hypothetical protein BV210_02380 [Halorientalis sp. IM1011]
MPTQATVYRILIATPAEVEEETYAATNAVLDWNSVKGRGKNIHLEPVQYPAHVETDPDDLASEFDLVIGAFWTQTGGIAESGSSILDVVRRLAFNESVPTIVGFSEKEIPPGKLDPEQYGAVEDFREECRSEGLYFTYESIEEYQSQLEQELTQTMAGLLDGPSFTTKDDTHESSEYDPEVDHERLRLSAEMHREQDVRNIQRVVDHFEEVGIDQPYRVLDTGCGYGTVTRDRFGNDDRFDVVGIDHTKSVVKTAREEYAAPNIEYRWMDVNNLGDSSLGAFDLVFSSYLFHHLENQEPVLSLLWEHVDDDGALLVRSCDDGQHLHYPPDKDMDWVVEITDEIKGSSDRGHGRRLYTHMNRLTPAPEGISLDLKNYHTGGMDTEERRQYWDVFHSNRLHYAERLANRDEATLEDQDLYETMSEKMDQLEEKFVDNSHFLDAKSVPVAVAFK